jgi:glycerol-3-phosphate dehydrogenase
MSSLARKECLDRLRDTATWDIVVIGGGATGLGTAVDAASRGYRTLLLEARDFAQGTSSRSTKLIHGGVRYLSQGNVRLVREALRERGLLLRNAPHLVHLRRFVVPAYRLWQLPYYGTGLWLYDRLAGKLSPAGSRWISRTETLTLVPTVRDTGLLGGILYTDGQFDDARLAISLARTFADMGGCALNYLPVAALIRQAGRIAGLSARDLETGEDFIVTARAVVNATGVHADEIRRLDEPGAANLIVPSQGAHIVLQRSFLPGETAVMVPKTDDKRVLFAIPWCGRVLVGTTDTELSTLPLEPRPQDQEIDYLLDHAGRYLHQPPTRADVRSTFAGLRPLLRPAGGRQISSSRLSREHVVVVSESGLVTITGGKWTTYRPMARDAVDKAAWVGGLPVRHSATASLGLHGRLETADDPPLHLAHYGTDLPGVEQLMRTRAELGAQLHPALPYLAAQVVWAGRHEAARTVEDVLARRTRALFLDAQASIDAAASVAKLLGEELSRDAAWQADQVVRFRSLAADYRVRNR